MHGGGSGCIGRNPNYSEIISGGQTVVLGLGQPSLSHNGRFLARSVLPNSFEIVGSFLHDLESGVSQSLPGQAGYGRRTVTDDGAVLLVPTGSTQLVLWRPGPNTQAPIADISNVRDAELDATGATVVYTRVVAGQEGNTYTFFAVSTATGSRVQLAQVRGLSSAAVSADGGTIVLPAL